MHTTLFISPKHVRLKGTQRMSRTNCVSSVLAGPKTHNQTPRHSSTKHKYMLETRYCEG